MLTQSRLSWMHLKFMGSQIVYVALNQVHIQVRYGAEASAILLKVYNVQVSHKPAKAAEHDNRIISMWRLCARIGWCSVGP